MNRLTLLKSQLSTNLTNNKNSNSNNKTKKQKILPTPVTFLNYHQTLTSKEIEYLSKFKSFLSTEIKPYIKQYVDKSEYPGPLVIKLCKAFPNLVTFTLKGHPSFLNLSKDLSLFLFFELALDGSFSLPYLHQSELVINTIFKFGSKEHIDYYIPKLVNFDLIGSFNLSEPDYGSDATSLITYAVEKHDSKTNEKYFVLNGHKKWAANVMVADFFIIWARYNNNINAFIVDKNTPGVETIKINNKLSLKGVQNGEVILKNVKIPISNRLPRANDFATATNMALLPTRLGTAIAALAVCIKGYEKTIEYVSKRVQFNKPLSSHQLIQKQISFCMADIQAMYAYIRRLMDMDEEYEPNDLMGRVSLCKSYCTEKARHVLRNLRGLMGGNGLLYENDVMRMMMDLESYYTFEGTYDINMMVSSRELLFKAAFKS